MTSDLAAKTLRARTLARLLALLVPAVFTISLALPVAPAAAHASLVGVDPVDGARLQTPPARVTLTFSEPVEVPTGGLRVFDADARRIDEGVLDTGDDTTVAVALPEALPEGGYVVTFRVISTDAHPIGGVSAFTVGEAPAVDAATVGELAEDAGDGPARPVGMALRGLSYLATLLAGGGAVFAMAVARQPGDRLAARRVATRAAGVGVAVTLLGVPVQAVALTGGIGAAFSVTSLGEVIGSTFGAGTFLRAAALLWLVVLWRPRTPAAVPVVAGLAAVASFAMDGHQRRVEPTWLLVGGDLVHLVAAAAWFGGLVLLGLAVRRRSLDDDPLEAAGLVARFSTLALVAVVFVTIGGVAMALPLVGSPSALTSTTYGWLLVAKISAVALAVLVASYNRRRLVPAIAARRIPAGGSVDAPPADEGRTIAGSHAAWLQLRRTLRIEVALLAAVLLTTGVLVAVQPASEAAGLGGPYVTSAPLGEDLTIDMIVDPNEVGRNAIHLFVVDATGRPAGEVEDLRLELTYVPEGIGPIEVEPFSAGPGHWIANIDELTFPGNWELRIVAGVDRFTERSTSVTVPVAP